MLYKVPDKVVVEIRAHQVGASLSTREHVSLAVVVWHDEERKETRDVLRPPRPTLASMLPCIRDETQ